MFVLINMDKICFSTDTFYIYTFILSGLLIYFAYFYYYKRTENLSNIDINSGLSINDLKNRLQLLQEKLYDSQLDNQKCNYSLAYCKNNLRVENTIGAGPERVYNSPNSNNSYSVLGYVYKDNDRYPLYGRYKYPGRSDRYEYYIIDESRNRLKIPFKTTNDNELYDGDSIDIPTLGNDYGVKIYDYTDFRYNPNI
jgi:hypothetical protein